MENGEMVAVCLDCYEQLTKKFREEAKYGIPVDKRQYIWIQIPPPPLAGTSEDLHAWSIYRQVPNTMRTFL